MRAPTAHERGGVSVVLDVRDPFSYLALGPLRELGRETGAPLDWLPLRGHTLVPPSAPAPGDDRGTRHRRYRAQALAREIRVYAEARGLEVASPYRDGPAEALHLAWLFVRETAPERLPGLLEAAFRAYWAQALEPDDPARVARSLGALGHDVADFETWAATAGPGALQDAERCVAELCVTRTPACLVGEELFLGRQHLPMIRWLLAGRTGAPPI